jgi:hypothetical protein
MVTDGHIIIHKISRFLTKKDGNGAVGVVSLLISGPLLLNLKDRDTQKHMWRNVYMEMTRKYI